MIPPSDKMTPRNPDRMDGRARSSRRPHPKSLILHGMMMIAASNGFAVPPATTRVSTVAKRSFLQMSSATAKTKIKKTSVRKKKKEENTDYGAGQITVLEGLEPVRKRPGMYIGSTGPNGLHHLVWEVLDNSVDEAIGGYADLITLTLNPNGSVSVTDNGRGIPTDIHPSTGVSALETVLTVLHAGGKFDSIGSGNGGYKVSGGLHGVGISVVNALSSFVEVEVLRSGKKCEMRFEKGVPVGSMRTSSVKEEGTGTSVTFLPDIDVFKTENGIAGIEFDISRLKVRMEEIAYLNPTLTLTLKDDRTPTEQGKEAILYHHPGGLLEYIQVLCKTKTPLINKNTKKKRPKKSLNNPADPLHSLLSPDGSTILLTTTEQSNSEITTSIALRWSADQYTETIISFCNNIRTKDGGTHVDGFKSAITRILNSTAKKSKKLKEGQGNLPGEYIREGLTAIISVSVPDPEFEGQTKGRLGSPEVRQAVDAVVVSQFGTVLDFRPEILDAIVSKATAAMSAANAAKAARDMIRRKSLLTSTILPGKLADCASKNLEETEIFIVEGDSAAGSAKQGRDRKTQAILPLRGKILNIERVSPERIYQNAELQGLISALGLGIMGAKTMEDGEFDSKSLRYGKIVIMTDADVDGAHIRVLLLTFLYRYQRELIERGHVYIAQPPLYKLTSGKKVSYAYNEEQKVNILDKLDSSKKVEIQRFKGLGEMMPQQLWDTTMNPEKRTLLQVTVDDGAEADQMLSLLMGDAVEPRRNYITMNAENMKVGDLDI